MIEPVVEQVDSEESEQEDNDDVGDEGEVTCTGVAKQVPIHDSFTTCGYPLHD
jgi:hypothetical protein